MNIPKGRGLYNVYTMEVVMKKIGIIGAMAEEVSILKENMSEVSIRNIAGMEFYEGSLDGKEVVVVMSGIGKVNAAICTQVLVDIFSVDAIINTGIAGSLNAEINICDIVLSSDAIQHDMDVTNWDYKHGQIPRMETSTFVADPVLIEKAKEVCKDVNPDIRTFVGRVVSGDQFICSKEKKQWLAEYFKADCTEMEGASIAHAAYLNKVPFLIIRAISDKADDSADMAYEEFEGKAIKYCVNLVRGLLQNIA